MEVTESTKRQLEDLRSENTGLLREIRTLKLQKISATENIGLLEKIKSLKLQNFSAKRALTGEVEVTYSMMTSIEKRREKLQARAERICARIKKAFESYLVNRKRVKRIEQRFKTWKLRISNTRQRTMLSHVKNRDEGKCPRYKQMYTYGSRFQFKYAKIIRSLHYNFLKSKKGPWIEVGISRKLNGIHFSAEARITEDSRLEITQVQGKQGPWRREENWSVIKFMLDRVSLSVDYEELHVVQGKRVSNYIIAGELLGPKNGNDASENHMNTLAHLSQSPMNLTITLYDFHAYFPAENVGEKPVILRFMPIIIENIFNEWRRQNAAVPNVFFDSPITITSDEWKAYMAYREKFKPPKLKVFIVSHDDESLLIDHRFDRIDEEVLYVPPQCITFIERVVQTLRRLTNDEKDAISRVIEDKGYPNERESYALSQVIERYTALQGNLTPSEWKHARLLTTPTTASGRRMLHSARYTDELTREFLKEKLAKLHGWLIRGRRDNHEGLVISMHRKTVTHHKCKVSYNSPCNPECALFKQTIGVVLGYRITLPHDVSSVKSDLPNVLVVYTTNLRNGDIELKPVAKAYFNWKHEGTPARSKLGETVDIESKRVDSSGISEKAAKMLMLELLRTATSRNVKFFEWTGPDTDYRLVVQIGDRDRTLLLKPSKRNYLTYVLFQGEKPAFAMTLSQLIFIAPSSYRADGWFIRSVIFGRKMIPPELVHVIYRLMARLRDKELPLEVRLLLSMPVVKIPCLIPLPSDEFYSDIVMKNSYKTEASLHNMMCCKKLRRWAAEDFHETSNAAPMVRLPIYSIIDLTNQYLGNQRKLQIVQGFLPHLKISSIGVAENLRLPDLIKYFEQSYNDFLRENAWKKATDYDDYVPYTTSAGTAVHGICNLSQTNMAIEYIERSTGRDCDVASLNCAPSSITMMKKVIGEYLKLANESKTAKVTLRGQQETLRAQDAWEVPKKKSFYVHDIMMAIKRIEKKDKNVRPCDTNTVYCNIRPFHCKSRDDDDEDDGLLRISNPLNIAPATHAASDGVATIESIPGLEGIITMNPDAQTEDEDIMKEEVTRLTRGRLTSLNPWLYVAARYILEAQKRARNPTHHE